MAWERVRIWHWVLIAVGVGFAVAGVRAQYAEDAIKGLGESLNGQRQFEEALLRTVRGHRQFEGAVVTPERIDDGKVDRKFVHVVRGMYWDGSRRVVGGVEQVKLGPAFFVAEVPYRCQLDLSTLGPQGAELAKRLAAVKDPTVVEFLAAVRETHGVGYSYQWWRGSAYARWMWVGGCVVVIGLGMPVLINLTVFGTLLRPFIPKEEGIDLSKVQPAPAAEAKATVTDEDLAKLAELDRELEARLARGAVAGAPAGAAEGGGKAVRKLSGGPLDPAAAQDVHDDRAFGAKADDFYPTERRAKH